MTSLAKDVAAQIKDWLDDGGWSQSAFAKRVKMPQSSLSRTMAGKSLPSLRTVQRIAKALHADAIIQIIRKDASPLNVSLVERVAAAMVDSHPR